MSGFDDLIRGKLAAARHEGTPDWEALAGQLDGETFDASLRGALPATGFTTAAFTGAPAPDWAALSGRLDGEAFDGSLREALPTAGLTVAAMGGAVVPDWAAMLGKLDAAAEADGDAFDRLISRRLAEVETDLAPADSWRQLSHRIDTLWPLRKAFVRYRVLEIAAAVALILTFVPLLRDNPVWHRSTPVVVDATGRQGKANGGSVDAASTPSTYSPLNNLAQAFGLEMSVVEVASPDEIAALFGAVAEPTLRLQTPEGELNTLVPVSAAGLSTGGLSGAGMLNVWVPTPPSPRVTAKAAPRTHQPLPSVTLSPLALTASKLVIAPPATKAARWSFGASGTYKAWQIFTPLDRSFDRGSGTRGVSAPQIGGHALYTLSKRWRLGAGVAMTSATYGAGLPEVVRAANGTSSRLDLSERFRSIDLDIAQATVDVRYGLLPGRRKVQVWAKAGLGGNVFLRTDYDVQRTLGDQFGSTNTSTEPDSGIEAVQARPEPSLSRDVVYSQVKDFPSGLVEGGSFAKTVQYFGRLGIEAEARLGERLRVFGSLDGDFVLPQQAGFGPNDDRFGAVGVEFGVRVSL